MTDQSENQEFPVYFGYSDSPKTHPTDGIESVRTVILAMSDLLQNYRDPNELGTNPDGTVRAGIHLVFQACAMQLDAVTHELQGRKDAPGKTTEPQIDDCPSPNGIDKIQVTETTQYPASKTKRETA